MLVMTTVFPNEEEEEEGGKGDRRRMREQEMEEIRDYKEKERGDDVEHALKDHARSSHKEEIYSLFQLLLQSLLWKCVVMKENQHHHRVAELSRFWQAITEKKCTSLGSLSNSINSSSVDILPLYLLSPERLPQRRRRGKEGRMQCRDVDNNNREVHFIIQLLANPVDEARWRATLTCW